MSLGTLQLSKSTNRLPARFCLLNSTFLTFSPRLTSVTTIETIFLDERFDPRTNSRSVRLRSQISATRNDLSSFNVDKSSDRLSKGFQGRSFYWQEILLVRQDRKDRRLNSMASWRLNNNVSLLCPSTRRIYCWHNSTVDIVDIIQVGIWILLHPCSMMSDQLSEFDVYTRQSKALSRCVWRVYSSREIKDYHWL